VNAPLPPGRTLARGLGAAALLLLAAWLLRDFLPALAWSVVIALSTWSLHQRQPIGRHPGTRAALSTLLVGLVFLVPLFYLLVVAGQEAQWLADRLAVAERQGLSAPDWLAHLPMVGADAVAQWNALLGRPGALGQQLAQWHPGALVSWGGLLGAQLLHRLTTLGFCLLALFFLYRDGEALSKRVLTLAELALGPVGERYLRHAADAVRAAVGGLVLVAAGEGVLIWLAYVLAGLPSAAVWGFATAGLAMVPFAAPLAVMAAGLVLLAQGKTLVAVVVVLWGLAVLFVADHFVRPGLIGGAVRLPFLWVLLGILGGVAHLGLLGLFVGPMIMALAVSLWREIPATGG
jgi:predicted PurR-regulated permease PerM